MIHLKDIYENKMKSYESIDMLNRGFLINLDDEKTDKNPTGSFLNVNGLNDDLILPRLRADLDNNVQNNNFQINLDTDGWVDDITQHEGFNETINFDLNE